MTSAMIMPWATRMAGFEDPPLSITPPLEPEPLPEPPSWPVPDSDPLPSSSPSAETKGLLSSLTVAWVRSIRNRVLSSCCWMVASRSVVSSDGPSLQAPIQLELVLWRDISPPSQDSQLAQATLAVMTEPSTPLPARRVSRAALLLVSSLGSVCPTPRRGDRVTFPLPSWYIRKMLAPAMPEPVPNATHWNEVGARIWK